MKPRIAIPEPHSASREYSARSLPQYVAAIEQAGGEAVVIPLDASPEQIAKLLATTDAVLLPGSRADVDPQKYNAPRHPSTAPADPRRDTADELLLQDAYNMRKPVLGICYGLQMLNVYNTGTLVQDIAGWLEERGVRASVNHAAGREVAQAHDVNIDPGSRLARILADAPGTSAQVSPDFTAMRLKVNSSHHQAAGELGDGLRVAARCPDDGVIEAIEGVNPGHFVLAVQWHPERSPDDPASQALFRALVDEARKR